MKDIDNKQVSRISSEGVAVAVGDKMKTVDIQHNSAYTNWLGMAQPIGDNTKTVETQQN
ncbi:MULTISPECIES: hypothetical protein [Mycobacterium]|uniref:hypothetical protein n=1 Tax=Mycobacterium TaxID=1763 RepID=UPI0012FE9487|nr:MULTISPECIES: hypothetical protein [Mycobacterium]